MAPTTTGGGRGPTTTATSTRCANVGFTPNSDNVASAIVATGLTCAEAQALVRRVGPPLGPGGPARAEADGFTCIRTGQSSAGLESATYECTNGPRKVSFTRT